MAEKKGSIGIGYFWHAARNPPTEPKASFAGKTILITGANSGVGYEAAKKFAVLGASLILGVRDPRKGEAAKSTICSSAGINPLSISIIVEQVDYNSFHSVQEFASRISKQVPRLDIVLLNAGVARPAFAKSPEGWEFTLQTTVLSTALLAILLLPKLRQTAVQTHTPALLQFTGSEAYWDVPEDWVRLRPNEGFLEHFNKPENFDVNRHYYISKLLVLWIQQGLVSALATTAKSTPNPAADPIILLTSPGLCRTNLGRDFGLGMKSFMAVFQAFVARTAEQGSRSLVSGAAWSSRPAASAHGRFWCNDVMTDAEENMILPERTREELGRTAWEEILTVLEKERPDIRGILAGGSL